MTQNGPDDTIVLQLYRSFLQTHSSARASMFDNEYGGDSESALCEAYSWKWLAERGVLVIPNELQNSDGLSMDFRCTCQSLEFMAEVTCLKESTAQACTDVSDTSDEMQVGGPITNAIRQKCKGKAKQCAGWNVPSVLIVGTFQQDASRRFQPGEPDIEWLLAGITSQTFYVDKNEGKMIGGIFESTKGEGAAFLKDELDAARQSISELLLIGFGVSPPNVVRLIHPEAIRPFLHFGKSRWKCLQFSRSRFSTLFNFLRCKIPNSRKGLPLLGVPYGSAIVHKESGTVSVRWDPPVSE